MASKKKVIKRGRPSKKKVSSSSKKKTIKKRKIGRPKGSKNKKTIERELNESIKNSAPKPVEINVLDATKPEGSSLSNIKTKKIIGYCYDGCGGMISNEDFVTARKFKCYRCGERKWIKNLDKELPENEDRPKTKKEYLQSSQSLNFVDNIGTGSYIPINISSFSPEQVEESV